MPQLYFFFLQKFKLECNTCITLKTSLKNCDTESVTSKETEKVSDCEEVKSLHPYFHARMLYQYQTKLDLLCSVKKSFFFKVVFHFVAHYLITY